MLQTTTRRRFLTAAAAALAAMHVAGGALAASAAQPREGAGEVVLYYSADEPYAKPIIEEFEKRTGITVKAVGDTEATKTTGLAQRLLAERNRPRADVFWSSEPVMLIRLAQQGMFDKHDSEAARERPDRYIGTDHLWHGFAERPRVLVMHERAMVEPPVDPEGGWQMRGLFHPDFVDGRVAYADPRFGTTASHLAALYTMWGEEAYRGWCYQMRRQRPLILDGNATVVRAVAQRETLVGLTDSDDVYAGQRNDWPIVLVPVRNDLFDIQHQLIEPFGILALPNTVGKVKGGPNPENAAKLMDYLLSADVERMLAESGSKNTPVRPEVLKDFPDLEVEDPAEVDFEELAKNLEPALRLYEQAFPR